VGQTRLAKLDEFDRGHVGTTAETNDSSSLREKHSRRRRGEMADEPARLSAVTEVAAFLGIPPTTLYQWRYRGYGPPGRYLRYDPRDVRTWFASQDNDGAP
jgi:hypothetical protein